MTFQKQSRPCTSCGCNFRTLNYNYKLILWLYLYSRGSDSLNWREEPTKPIPAPSVHHPHPPHSTHFNPPSHQHSFYHQAHQIDPEHQEIARFLYEREYYTIKIHKDSILCFQYLLWRLSREKNISAWPSGWNGLFVFAAKKMKFDMEMWQFRHFKYIIMVVL